MKPVRRMIGALLFVFLVAAPASMAHGGPEPLLPQWRTDADAAPAAWPPMGYPLLPVAAKPRWVPADADAEPYGIRFKCPGSDQGLINGEASNLGGCPLLLLDTEDIMSQPVLLVDPQNPKLMAFNALHGGRGLFTPLDPPPGERSRYNLLHQPHTTWQSTTGGGGWADRPYYAPDGLQAGNRSVFGEDNAAVLDAQGRLYVASLYGYREPPSSPQYHYAIGLWKLLRMNREPDYFGNLAVLKIPDNHSVDGIHLVHTSDTDRIILLWREIPNGSNKTNQDGFVNIYWTKPGEGARWEALSSIQRVGPCRDMSSPLAFRHLVYFGCLPGAGYTANASAIPDRLQIHALDTRDGSTHYVAPTPVGEGHTLLVARGVEGHMILLNSGVTRDGLPYVKVSYGALGELWGDPDDYGPRVTKACKGLKVLDARVTAAAYTRETGYVHFIYLERYQVQQTDGAAQSGERSFCKTYAVARPLSGFQGYFNGLAYGDVQSRRPFPVQYRGGLDEGIFDDLHDSIVVWRDPKTEKERLFTAFGDYGFVRFAEVVEEFALPAIPLPPLSAPPIPLAVEAANSAATGAAAAALVALMLLRLLAAKKAATSKVTA